MKEVNFKGYFLKVACESKNIEMVNYFIGHITLNNIPFINDFTTNEKGCVWENPSINEIFNSAFDSGNEKILKILLEKYIKDSNSFPYWELKSILDKQKYKKTPICTAKKGNVFKNLGQNLANVIMDSFISFIERDQFDYEYYFVDFLIQCGDYKEISINIYEKILEKYLKLMKIRKEEISKILKKLYFRMDLKDFLSLVFKYFTKNHEKDFYEIKDFIEFENNNDFLCDSFNKNAFSLILRQEFKKEFYECFLKKISSDNFEGLEEEIDLLLSDIFINIDKKLYLIEIIVKHFEKLPEKLVLELIGYSLHVENEEICKLLLKQNINLNKYFRLKCEFSFIKSGKEYSLISYFIDKFSLNKFNLFFIDILNRNGVFLNFKGLREDKLAEELMRFFSQILNANVNKKALACQILTKFLNLKFDIKTLRIIDVFISKVLIAARNNKNFAKIYNTLYKCGGLKFIQNKLALHSLEALSVFKVLHLEKFDDNLEISNLKMDILEKYYLTNKKIDKEHVNVLSNKCREILFKD